MNKLHNKKNYEFFGIHFDCKEIFHTQITLEWSRSSQNTQNSVQNLPEHRLEVVLVV